MAGAIRHLCRLGKIECIANRPGSTELQIIPAVAWAHLILELSSCDRPKARARDCELPPHGCATHDWPGLFFLPLPTGRLIQWLGEGKAVIYENAVYSQISESSRPAPRANNHMPAITGRQKPGPEPTERARVIDALRKDGRSLQELRSEKQEVLCAEFETSRATLRRALAGLESTG